MKRIKISQGKYALVDDSDYESLMKFKWYARKDHLRDVYYTNKSEKVDGTWKNIPMHRVIMNPPNGMFVDHKDGDGLNNQRSNLRVCTASQNNQNSKKASGKTSQYKGVSWSAYHNRWRACIEIQYRQKYIGVFRTELEAAIIWNMTARKYFGEFALLNKLKKVS